MSSSNISSLLFLDISFSFKYFYSIFINFVIINYLYLAASLVPKYLMVFAYILCQTQYVKINLPIRVYFSSTNSCLTFFYSISLCTPHRWKTLYLLGRQHLRSQSILPQVINFHLTFDYLLKTLIYLLQFIYIHQSVNII